jgi:hypothetical protein
MPVNYCPGCGMNLKLPTMKGSTIAERRELSQLTKPKPRRKLSAWNKFVKDNSSKPRFRLRSGSPNLKKLGVAFRKTPAGKKKRR